MKAPHFLPIHQAPNESEAHKLKGYLERNGVKAIVRAGRPNFEAGNMSGEALPPRHLEPHNVHVHKEQKREAQALINDYYRKQPQFPHS